MRKWWNFSCWRDFQPCATTTFTIVVWAGAGCVMGMLGKVVAISGGVFAGGGLGFYLKETYYLRLKREERSRLEEE